MKIAINGFGRIGRTFFRAAHELGLNIVAANDLCDLKTLAHLIKYDSTYGKFPGKIEVSDNNLVVDNKKIEIFSEKEPEKLPWQKFGIDLVIESTGVFVEYDLAAKHLTAGAERVLVTAPAKGEKPVKTFVLGVNEDKFEPAEDKVISMASCTTNALVPIADVLHKNFGIDKGMLNTVHSVTMDQRLQDSPHKDLRRARSVLESIIPTTTGATIATSKVLPELEGKMDGISLRVPIPTVSVIDFVAVLEKNVTKNEVNAAFEKASKDGKYKGSIAVTKEPLVSADFKSNPAGAIVDLELTQVVGQNLVRIIAWYDNEMGYSYRLAEFVKYISEKS
ncbi:Glyceraldehyde-3-phosphate dehydrogenase [subsurface metagenome]